MSLFARVVSRLRRSEPSELGASLVEYALLLALIAVVAIGGITLVGRETKREFGCVAIEFNHPGARQFLVEKIDNGGQLTTKQARGLPTPVCEEGPGQPYRRMMGSTTGGVAVTGPK